MIPCKDSKVNVKTLNVDKLTALAHHRIPVLVFDNKERYRKSNKKPFGTI
jgi:hypothetical protein